MNELELLRKTNEIRARAIGHASVWLAENNTVKAYEELKEATEQVSELMWGEGSPYSFSEAYQDTTESLGLGNESPYWNNEDLLLDNYSIQDWLDRPKGIHRPPPPSMTPEQSSWIKKRFGKKN